MIIFILNILLIRFAVADNYNAYVNTTLPYFHPDPDRWLSMALDQAVMVQSSNWSGVNLSYVVPLARAFQPARLRWGGWQQDYVVYNFYGNNTDKGTHSGQFLYVMSPDQLDTIYSFVKNAGWEFSYGLTLWQDFNGVSWNSSNTKVLLDYASSKGYALDFELGQEPDLFPGPITGTQLANSFATCRELLKTYDLYKNSILMGPSIAQIMNFPQMLTEFISSRGGNYVNAVTFHHYYFTTNSQSLCSDLGSWISPDIMDNLTMTLEFVTSNYSYRPLWLSETGTGFYCWTAQTYISGFLWLDKLGLSAKYRLNQVNRETFFGISLGLVSTAMKPCPDYWVSLLYKKMVGGAVYNISFTPDDRYIRLYAGSSTSDYTTIVVYGVSVKNDSFTLDLPQFSNRQAALYVLKESDAGDLQSNFSRLNGDLLDWNTHQPGPYFKKNITTLPVILPAFSQFYIVLNQTKYSACPKDWYNEKTTANKCVIFKTGRTYPFFAARLECDVFGTNSSTLTIGNAFENAEILTQSKSNGSGQFYIGLIRNGTDWVWSNGETSSYRNWQQGYPNNDTTKNCVTFDSTDGTWTNSDCDDSQFPICQLYF